MILRMKKLSMDGRSWHSWEEEWREREMKLEGSVGAGKTYKKGAGRVRGPGTPFSALCWGLGGQIHPFQPQMNLRVADSRGPTPVRPHTMYWVNGLSFLNLSLISTYSGADYQHF